MTKFLLLIFFSFILLFFLITKKEKNKYFKEISEKIENTELIDKINKNSTKISSIFSNLIIKQGFFSTQGHIRFARPDKFGLICYSLFGKEIEIGTNKNYFWFYSRNLKPKALYYCEINKIEKTRIKKIFYPSILIEFLGINQIKNKQIQKSNNYYFIEEKIIIQEEVFNKIIIIKENKIAGYKLCNFDNKIIIEMEILEFQIIQDIILPKKIKVNYLEESLEQFWELSNSAVNIYIDDWEIPNYKNKINIIDY